MPRLDFKEIPQANGKEAPDTFELFARDFLDQIGYEVVIDPSRGPDGGRDLIVRETRKGIGGKTTLHWLVSCKHFAHSNKSVGAEDELEVQARVTQHNCQGFIGFYSTLPSTALSTRLETFRSLFEIQTFDREKIEANLLSSPQFSSLIERYFPISFRAGRLDDYVVNLAMARLGQPYPVLFQHPTEKRTIDTMEALELSNELRQYGYIAWTGEMFLFNNVLGITKIRRGDQWIDPTIEELQRIDNAREAQMEHLRRHQLTDQEDSGDKSDL